MARATSKGDFNGPYYDTNVYHDQLLRQSSRVVYGDGALKKVAARFSQFAMEWRVQSRSFDRITERLRNDEMMCCFSVFFCACFHIIDYRCAKEIKEIDLHQNKLPRTARSLNSTFHQKTTSRDDHIGDQYCVFLQASEKNLMLRSFL